MFSGSLDELLLALLSVICTNDIVNLFSAIESPPLMIAERSEANNRAVCDLGWRMYIY